MKDKILYSITAIVIALILGGSYIYVSSRKDSTERLGQSQAAQIKQEHPNQQKLNSCLAEVESGYQNTIRDAKKAAGLREDENLSYEAGKNINDQYTERKNTCFKQYPVN